MKKRETLFWPVKIEWLAGSILLCLLCSVKTMEAQDIIRGQVLDTNDTPIPYCTIGIFGSSKGVVSDANGFFQLPKSKVSAYDSLKITHVAYEAKILPIEELISGMGPVYKVRLKPKEIDLGTVTVYDFDAFKKPVTLGSKNIHSNVHLSYYVLVNYGEMLGSVLRLKRPGLLKRVRFKVDIDSSCQSVGFRLVIKKSENRTPAEEDILVSSYKMEVTENGWQTLDMTNEFLVLSDDFFIGLEYLFNHGCRKIENEKGIEVRPYKIALGDYKETFFRSTNTSKWLSMTIGIAFQVELLQK